MLNKELIGHIFPSHSVEIEAGRLRFFAKAIGETNPIYTDHEAARGAGYRALPAPPTFLFSAELERPDPLDWVNTVGLDLGRILHGEQSFQYYQDVCAGDTVTFETRVADIFDKKDGALEFVVRESKVTNQEQVHIADLKAVIVQRNT